MKGLQLPLCWLRALLHALLLVVPFPCLFEALLHVNAGLLVAFCCGCTKVVVGGKCAHRCRLFQC